MKIEQKFKKLNVFIENENFYYKCSKCCGDIIKYINPDEFPIIESIQTFKNGTTHLRLECGKCNSFLSYGFQEKEITFFPFGKYKGKNIKEIPNDYLKWLLNQGFIGDNIKFMINKHLFTNNKPN